MFFFIQVSAGGSLSNTLIGLSRLGQADNCLRGSGGFQVALAAAVGCDTLGSFFAAQAAKAGIALLEDPVADSCTGVHTTTPAPTLPLCSLFSCAGNEGRRHTACTHNQTLKWPAQCLGSTLFSFNRPVIAS